jgi:predicted nucleic acid-binding protein
MPGILLDTNVISEAVAPLPTQSVLRWLAAQLPQELHLSVITLGELEQGVAKRGPSRRSRELLHWIENNLPHQFEARVLPFDRAAARQWGRLLGEAERRGRPLPAIDAQIAATALVHDLAVATRDSGGFVGTGVTLIDPWRS